MNAQTTAKQTKGSQKTKKAKTKKQTAIQLLRRANGASLNELEKRLSWQPHTVRGFLSSTIRKLEEFDLTSQLTKTGIRRYRLITKEVA